MEVGLMEPADRMIEPNRHLKAVLTAKGYDVAYHELAGGHAYALWRGAKAMRHWARSSSPWRFGRRFACG